MRVPTSRGIALLDTEKSEDIADSLETQFQPVFDPSLQPAIELADVALRIYFLTLATEPQ